MCWICLRVQAKWASNALLGVKKPHFCGDGLQSPASGAAQYRSRRVFKNKAAWIPGMSLALRQLNGNPFGLILLTRPWRRVAAQPGAERIVQIDKSCGQVV